jgi:disulfide bond formation protein DsbB
MLITWAAILFAIAAVGGATLATLHFRGRSPLPMPLALLHGLLAAGGLVLLVVAALTQPGFGGLALVSLVIFVIAALGGFYLFSHHLRARLLPSAVVLIHGGAAVAAFLLLLAYLFKVQL